MAKFLEDSFPELQGRITGDLYPTPPIAELLSKLISLLKLIGILWMVVGGKKLLRLFYRAKRPLPAFYWTVQDNPVPIFIFLFLLAPQILAKLRSNEAFEVYLLSSSSSSSNNNVNSNDAKNRLLIFSKLKFGAMPRVDDLVKPLVAAGLKMVTEAATTAQQ